ncbi:MAG: efflux RND transporter periplasmic adaptor subunit [Butyrivibrio sp.]|nr:efflux RND transporter periplasmic adaptor subunit [Butyrivibrio sp.]
MKQHFFRKKAEQIAEWSCIHKKRAVVLYSATALILIAAIVTAMIYKSKSESENSANTVYREETVTKGALTVGITEEGTVTIGTTTQTLDVDISAYTGSDSTTTNSWPNAGGGGMPGQQTQTTTTTSTDSDTRELEVKQVYVNVGQEVAKGDPIALLDADSVNDIKADLQADVEDAKNTYDETRASQTISDQTAEQNYKLYTLYGDTAQSEYDTSVATLQDAVDSAQQDLDDANDTLQDYQDQLTEDQTNLPTFKKALENATYTANGIDKETAMYGWLTAENSRETAQKLVDNTEDEIDDLTDEIKAQNTKIAEYEIALESAKKAYELGVIQTQATKDTHIFQNQNADTYLSVSKAQDALATEEAKDDLTQAEKKLSEFDSYIQNNEIIAAESGVISAVSITAGDNLYSNSDLITVNDYDKVTAAVDVSEDDIDYAKVGAAAKVNIDAFPDTVFDASVTDVGDASYDSSTGTTSYEVTVTLSGDLSELYSGMTAEVTFITKDTENVLYIPNRAVTREDGKSYVKLKKTNGSIITQQVTTGFSDGTNVEVKDGLSEGDTVVIESKVDSK